MFLNIEQLADKRILSAHYCNNRRRGRQPQRNTGEVGGRQEGGGEWSQGKHGTEKGDTEQQQPEYRNRGKVAYCTIVNFSWYYFFLSIYWIYCRLTWCIFGSRSYLNNRNQANPVHTLYLFLLKSFPLCQNNEDIWSKTNTVSHSNDAISGSHQLLPPES